ncbi:MAG: protein translocase subunit SecF [Actinomycetota bacterium]|nr:protein translocase subunit SecF [Actinomycetota bacterium]
MFGGLRTVARGDSKIDFVGRIKVWAIISGAVLLISLVALFWRGLNLGLSFKGGTSMRAPLNTAVTVPQLRNVMEAAGVADAEVQIAVGPPPRHLREALIQSKHLSPEELPDAQQALAKAAGVGLNDVNVEDVGPKWGREISKKALQGLIAFLILVVAYISFRFEPKMAAAAIAALFHDLIGTAGIYALVGFQVTPATVVAILTILGYSLYDTVVVFDKVRENTPGVMATKMSYAQMVNKSVNQVLMRSINTSLTSLIPVTALLIVGAGLTGAEQLKDLALALFIGILIGTYSSIFVASPLLAIWKEREPRYAAIKARQQREGRAAFAPVAATAVGSMDIPAEPVAASRSPRPGAYRPPAAKPRKKRRGKRKR